MGCVVVMVMAEGEGDTHSHCGAWALREYIPPASAAASSTGWEGELCLSWRGRSHVAEGMEVGTPCILL